MKHSSKPFAVEIKKSRRAPALPLEPVSKERADFGDPARAPRGKDRVAARPESGEDFAIPVFLQSDKFAPRAAADSWSMEAQQLFGPKPAAEAIPQPAEARAAPRILPSLIPSENPQMAADNNAPARSTRAAKTETPRGRRKAVRDERPNQERGKPARRAKGESDAVADAPRKAASVELQRETSLDAKREPKPRKASAPAPLPAPQPVPGRTFAKRPTQSAKDIAEGPPRISLARLGRDDAAALPRGQHWKRRLHPRAW